MVGTIAPARHGPFSPEGRRCHGLRRVALNSMCWTGPVDRCAGIRETSLRCLENLGKMLQEPG